MNDFQSLLFDLGVKGLMYYTLLVIYTVFIVRLFNGLLNFAFSNNEDREPKSGLDIFIWIFFILLFIGITVYILNLREII